MFETVLFFGPEFSCVALLCSQGSKDIKTAFISGHIETKLFESGSLDYSVDIHVLIMWFIA
jgi:hypothetical protein